MNENTFIIVDTRTGLAVSEVSDKFAQRHTLKPPFVYIRPSKYLPTLTPRN